jgi:hypothetical protein
LIPAPDLTIPRAKYGLWMGLATLAALGAAAAMAAALGGEAATIRAAMLATGIGALATFAPAVMVIGAEFWGVAVLVSGTVRSLAVVGLAYFYLQTNPALGTRPLMLSVSAGAMLVLAIEVIAAISLLSAIERRKDALRSSTAAGSSRPPAPAAKP